MKNKILHRLAFLLALIMASGCNSSVKTDHDEHHNDSEEAHGDMIELSEKQINTVGIRLGTFTNMALGGGVNSTGELMVDPQHIADVTPLMNGIIRSIRVREGDFIKAGTIVATVENLEINTLIRDYKMALSNLKLAQNEYDRQKKLSEHGAGIAKNLEKARIEFESANSIVDSYRSQMKMAGININQVDAEKVTESVKSPISGIVTKIYGKIGSEAGFSQPVISVTDNSGIYAMLRLYEKDIYKIKKGMPAEISLTNGSDIMQGKVEEIIRYIDPETKTINVRVGINGANKDKLIPGMAVSAYINTEATEVPALPEEAVVSLEGKNYIYVLAEKEKHDGQTMFIFRPVEVARGTSRNGFVEVTPVEELPQEAEIVISKAFYLASMASDHGEHTH